VAAKCKTKPWWRSSDRQAERRLRPILFPSSCHRSGGLEIRAAQSDKGELGSAGETSAGEVDGVMKRRREALVAGPTNCVGKKQHPLLTQVSRCPRLLEIKLKLGRA
jgi:hypothetical protein